MKKPAYADLGDLKEDRRIELIGHAVMVEKKTVTFIVDAEGKHGEEKAHRYIEKLEKNFPGIVVLSRGNGPVNQTRYVKVGPPAAVK